jgi:hypothetical protein
MNMCVWEGSFSLYHLIVQCLKGHPYAFVEENVYDTSSDYV